MSQLARLIAAAPDLLEALDQLVKAVLATRRKPGVDPEDGMRLDFAIDVAGEQLRNARGEQAAGRQ
jgi:hypothetical protein